jgi:hypothetical protein
MPDNIYGSVFAQYLKIPMIGSKPSIDHTPDLHFLFSQPDAPGSFFTTVSGVAFYFEV